MKLLITRHGKTEHNEKGIIQGKNHGQVNQEGFKQIKRLTENLKKEKIDLIISSDIPRCKTTVDEVLKEIKAPVEYTILIREKDNGDFVGQHREKVNWESLGNDFENRHPPNGESLVMVRERGRKFLGELLNRYKDSDKTILLVSHAAFLKVFIGDLLGMNLYNSIFRLLIDHCSITEIDFSSQYKEGFQLKYLNKKAS